MKTFSLIAMLVYNGSLQNLTVHDLSWNDCVNNRAKIERELPNAQAFCMDNELSKQVIRIK